MNLKVEIVRDPSIRGYSIWITNEMPDGTLQLAKPIEFKFGKQLTAVYEPPTLSLSGRNADDFLGSFATALAALGFKTDELKNVNQEIAAIKYHLDDMRKLVFKHEDIK